MNLREILKNQPFIFLSKYQFNYAREMDNKINILFFKGYLSIYKFDKIFIDKKDS